MILKKLINRSLGSVELGDQKKMLSYPVTIAKPNKKKKDTSSFLAKTHPMKSYGLFYYGLPNFLFLYKSILLSLSLGTCTWFTVVADHKLQFSADSE